MTENEIFARKQYLKILRPYIDDKSVKIIAGIHRSGKSYLLKMLSEELVFEEDVKESHIIYRHYFSKDSLKTHNTESLLKELTDQIQEKGKYYFLLEGFVEVEGWIQVIQSLQKKFNVDIYLTATKLTETVFKTFSALNISYILIPVFTLSLKEYLKFSNLNEEEAFDEFLLTGGFPLIASTSLNEQERYQVIEDIFNSAILKDVLKSHPIKETDKFEKVISYIFENLGKPYSANSIFKYLNNNGCDISNESVYNYLSWLKEAFIIYECPRYDLVSKSVLKTQGKFYLADISFRHAIMGFDASMKQSDLENIIFLEMKRRGYDVYLGKNGLKEIDFIAKKQEDEIQAQVTLSLPRDAKKMEHLIALKGFNHKYMVIANPTDARNINGVEVVYITDFLLRKNW